MTRGMARVVAALLASASPLAAEAAPDWLIDPSPYRGSVQIAADGRSLTLSNGLLRRTIRLFPNAATVALDNLMTGASEIRSVRPEAVVEIDGRRFDVGGLVGQPVHNYLLGRSGSKASAPTLSPSDSSGTRPGRRGSASRGRSTRSGCRATCRGRRPGSA